MTSRRRGARRAAACALLALAVGGCGAGYVAHAGYEEARILWRRQPIAEVLAQPDLDPATRAKLELVPAVRAYAADELGLAIGGSYTSVATVDADQVVHVVTAAPRTTADATTAIDGDPARIHARAAEHGRPVAGSAPR